ncbi:MAG: hypothetical protein ACR2IY_02510 [Rubrivivax sp.]
MSDNLDIASDREELDRAMAIAAKRPSGPTPTGRCLYCDEIVADHQRWCDAQCRDEWEAHRGR